MPGQRVWRPVAHGAQAATAGDGAAGPAQEPRAAAGPVPRGPAGQETPGTGTSPHPSGGHSSGGTQEVRGGNWGGAGQVGAADGWPEEPRLIAGSGRHAGRPPRGAGVIALRSPEAGESGIHVCIVEKADGKMSFPKGGRKPGEAVLQGALREWREECGIDPRRLQLSPGMHLDEAFIGVRYLVAGCLHASAAGGLGPDPSHPGEASWAPPCEDPTDRDPIVKASWISVDRLLQGNSRLGRERKDHLRRAVTAFINGNPAVLAGG